MDFWFVQKEVYSKHIIGKKDYILGLLNARLPMYDEMDKSLLKIKFAYKSTIMSSFSSLEKKLKEKRNIILSKKK